MRISYADVAGVECMRQFNTGDAAVLSSTLFFSIRILPLEIASFYLAYSLRIRNACHAPQVIRFRLQWAKCTRDDDFIPLDNSSSG